MKKLMKPVYYGVTLALVFLIGVMMMPVNALTMDFDFSGTPTSGSAPLTVEFEADVAYSGEYQVTWDFGDGDTGSGETASHTYTCAGEFDVTCTVSLLEVAPVPEGIFGPQYALANGAYTYEVIKEAYIRVYPVADFSASPTMGQAPLTVQFTDKSDGICSSSDASWYWSFGDGGTSTSRHPVHTYMNAGSYSVSLTVSGSPSDSKTIDFYIVVDDSEAAPDLVVREINVNPTYAKPGQEIQVTANVANEGGSWGSSNLRMLINGYFEQEQGVGLAPGTSDTLSFTVYKTTSGEYQVTMGDAAATFFVMEEEEQATPASGLLAGGTLTTNGIIAVVVIAVILVGGVILIFLFARRT